MKNNCLLLLLIFTCLGYGQNSKTIKIPVTKVDPSEKSISIENLLKQKLKPEIGTEFRLVESKVDKLGYTHKTYQQFYNGIKVIHGIIKVHEKNGLKETYNGVYYKLNQVNSYPSISDVQIVNVAKRFMQSNELFWIDHDGGTTDNISHKELLIYPDKSNDTFHLCYAVGVGISNPELKLGRLYIDANTSKVLGYKNQIFQCFGEEEEEQANHQQLGAFDLPLATGSGETVYSGTQTLETTLDGGNYTLYDQTRANTGQGHNYGYGSKNGIVTINYNHDDSFANYNNNAIISEYTDSNNTWTAAEMSTDEDQYALDAHWGAQVVYDYWKNEQGRDSYNDANASIASYVHFGTNYTNAAWVAFNTNRGFMIYGDGAGSWTPLTNLDVVGHEIGHGVTNANSNLDYELESGALNEGFSDIWAMVTENYANNTYGTSKDFSTINEENGNGVIRSLSNPNLKNQPDTYGGNFWVDVSGCTPTSANDYCGVHTNSGVLAYWFWLASQGDSGTNDNGDSYNILGIGIDKAAAIAYRTESFYLTNTSNFSDTRDAAIQAAKDLYGNCSNEEEVVTNAFYAVGVGSAYTGANPTIDTDIANVRACVDDIVLIETAATNDDSSQWQVNDGSGWMNLTEGAPYSGVTTDILSITVNIGLDGYQYRNNYSNGCGSTQSTAITFDAEILPIISNVISYPAGCSNNSDGSLELFFPNTPVRTDLEISIDGGATYPYVWDDSIGSESITGLTADSYNIWVRWENEECPLEIGDYTVGTATASVASILGSVEADIGVSDGILQLTFADNLTQSQIKFSIDGGVTYPYSLDDTAGTVDINGLAAGTYEVWVSNGDDSCPMSVGSETITEMAYTAIPDANFENALNDLTFDNYLGDSRVPTHLINTITSLNVRVKNIADMSGIEDFTALEKLYADNNQLTSIDLSNNLNLRLLQIYKNYNLTSFTIGDATKIERLNFQDCNLTGHLDLSDYTALKWLHLLNNDLTRLNVQNGNNTNFAQFDARNNANLTCITVDDVAYSTTNWTSIDAQTSFTIDNYCRYTAIPDANFENVLFNEGLDDVNGDGQVPTALIEVVTDLNVSVESISDLTGIEDFTALDNFRCVNNNITTLDFSNNLNLRELRCYNNPLTSLNVVSNTLLEVLKFDDTDITAIDVSQNLLLNELDCYDTNLISLDLTLNTALEILNASNNADLRSLNIQNGTNNIITSFNTTNTPKLYCIQVDDPSYSTTTWTNIDAHTTFSQETYCRYTAIPDTNFEAVLETLGYDDISNDGQVPTALIELVTDLDVSNQSIADLTGIRDFTALETLNCNDNTLIALDVSDLTNLTTIEGIRNDITTITATNVNSLVFLSLHSNELVNLDIILNDNLGIEHLEVFNNKLTALDLRNLTALKRLYANDNELTSLNVRNGTNVGYFFTFNARNNPNLTCINVDDVTFSTTNWTAIDAHTSFTEAEYCRYTLIPDANFENALFNDGLDDVNGDGKVPTALIEVVENLSYTNRSISDITGIEDFVALVTMTFEDNNITTVDLSNNVNLTSINLNNNNNLSTLDLNNNSLIELLFLTGNNFNTIDTSIVPNLKIIFINSNSIQSLDLTQNPNLIFVKASDNASLTTLDLRNGNNEIMISFEVENVPVLNCINVDDATYSTTNWTDIDAHTSFTETDYCDYTAIPDANFEAALEALGYDDISGDGQVPTVLIEVITTLNLRDKSIADLTGIENFTALTQLNCSKNQLTTLNISSNVALETLFAGENQLTSIDVTNNINLTYLHIADNMISSLDVSNNTGLTTLETSDNNFTTLNVTTLINLKTLYISDNAIASIDVTNNTVLENFAANNCVLTSFNASSLANLETITIQSNPDFETLNVNGATSLKHLVIRNGKLTNADVSTNINLETIFLDGHEFTSFDITNNPLVNILIIGSNPLLETLDLRNGNTEGITTFQSTGNDVLTCINIDNPVYASANLTDIDAHTSFGISACGVYAYVPDDNFETALGVLGYDDIADDNQIPLANIDTVTTLNVSGESIIDLTGIEEFIALTSLNISSNAIVDIDFSTNPLISTLNISDNQFIQLDLSTNTALTSVNVNQNPLVSFNIQNGVKTNITNFDATSTPSLTCILVDDAAYANTNWTNIDAHTSFNEIDCTEYTAIPDANFEAALEALGYDNISGDGQVPTLNINTITALNISSENIADLTGIEDFVALTTLDCSLNLLTTINVTNNVNLIDLDADENQFTAIDISHNTLLQDLDLDNCLIANIDLTTNTQLIDVDLQGNELTSINLTQNLLLEVIDLEENQLTSLDVSNNTLIEELDIEDNEVATLILPLSTSLIDLDATNNMLSSIDVSNYTNLEILDVDENQLVTLDVSQNTALTRLKVEENNLSFLNVKNGNNTNLTTFDATINANLTCILVDDATYSTTNWTTIDVQTSFNDTYCRYTAIPDINFETRLEALGYDDISSDGQVPTALIEVVTSLDVNNRSISDLTGIEDFLNLESLNCGNNPLGSLDVTQNVELTDLRCFSTGISTIDVSNNTKLTTLNIQENTLTGLDVTNNPLLETIRAFDNQYITSIDVSNNLQLIKLELRENLLTSLDVSNNLLLENLSCANNNIVSLDLSNNTALLGLNINSNALEYLNLKNGTNNQIVNFDTTLNNSLTCILVDDATYSTNNWTNIDAHTNFTSGYCRYTTISDANFEARLETLGYDDISSDGQVPTALIEVVTSVDLTNASISDLTGIEDFTVLTELYAANNQLTTIDVTNNSLLYEIDLASNQIATIDLTSNSDLVILGCASNIIASIDLSANVNLEYINLSDNAFTSVDLSSNTLLTQLVLEDLNLSNIDVTNNTLLQRLYVTNSQLSTLDISANTQLTRLYARDNNLTTLDTSNNNLLETLYCENNLITNLDLSSNINLERFTAFNNSLNALNIQNGSNGLIMSFNTRENPDLTCVLVDDETYSANSWTNLDAHTSFNETSCDYVIVDIDVFLQGVLLNPYAGEENLMRDDLRVAGALYGGTSPYGDGAQIDEGIGADDAGANSTVDWIWVELRDAIDPTIVIAGQSAILQRDGDVVDVAADRITPLTFVGVEEDDYYVVIKHRNHLGVMTANTVALSDTVTTVDFTDAANEITHGTNAQTTIGMPTGVYGMWAGDADADGVLDYNNDGNSILFEVLFDPTNASFSALYSGANAYYNGDFDVNGNTSFSDDRNNLLFNILFHPSNSSFSSLFNVTEQLPENSSSSRIATDNEILQRRVYIEQKLEEKQNQINNN